MLTQPSYRSLRNPVVAIVGGIEDHTAHHRGALTVYARLLDRVPPMPYMDPM